MKLYATTTSERASKGQGGNDFISIDVTDCNKELIAQIRFEPFVDAVGDGIRYRAWFDERLIEKTSEMAKALTEQGRIKGNKKKDDSGKDGICVACKGKNPEGCTYC